MTSVLHPRSYMFTLFLAVAAFSVGLLPTKAGAQGESKNMYVCPCCGKAHGDWCSCQKDDGSDCASARAHLKQCTLNGRNAFSSDKVNGMSCDEAMATASAWNWTRPSYVKRRAAQDQERDALLKQAEAERKVEQARMNERRNKERADRGKQIGAAEERRQQQKEGATDGVRPRSIERSGNAQADSLREHAQTLRESIARDTLAPGYDDPAALKSTIANIEAGRTGFEKQVASSGFTDPEIIAAVRDVLDASQERIDALRAHLREIARGDADGASPSSRPLVGNIRDAHEGIERVGQTRTALQGGMDGAHAAIRSGAGMSKVAGGAALGAAEALADDATHQAMMPGMDPVGVALRNFDSSLGDDAAEVMRRPITDVIIPQVDALLNRVKPATSFGSWNGEKTGAPVGGGIGGGWAPLVAPSVPSAADPRSATTDLRMKDALHAFGGAQPIQADVEDRPDKEFESLSDWVTKFMGTGSGATDKPVTQPAIPPPRPANRTRTLDELLHSFEKK